MSTASRGAPAPATSGSKPQAGTRPPPGQPAAAKGPQRVYIILSSASSSLLQLYNANALFNEKTFKPVTAEMVQSMTKPPYVDVKRTKADGTPLVFRFVDSPATLAPADWKQVVAVFALGQTWQFQQFPQTWREPAVLFQNGECATVSVVLPQVN